MLGGGIGIGCAFHGKAREKSGVTFIFPASLLSKSLLAASKEGTAREVLLREAQRLSAHSERVLASLRRSWSAHSSGASMTRQGGAAACRKGGEVLVLRLISGRESLS